MSEATTTTGETGEKSAFGLSPNLAAALSCFFGGSIIVPLIFYLMADDELTRFHSVQVIILNLIGYVTILGWIVMLLVNLFLTYKAYQGELWEFPVIGGFARNYA